MSKSEILQELPKLTKDERYEIRVKLAEMDSDGWLDEDDPLTDEKKKLIDAWQNTRRTRNLLFRWKNLTRVYRTNSAGELPAGISTPGFCRHLRCCSVV